MALAPKDAFTDFFRQPSKDSLAEIISLYPEEIDKIDFKKEWDQDDKIARHIIAMANSGGGIIVYGVEETNKNYVANGLSSRVDKADLSKKVSKYLPNKLEWDMMDFTYSGDHPLSGKVFQVLSISYSPNLVPFISLKDGKGICENRIYVRRQTESTEANYEEIQELFRVRLQSMFSSARLLKEHLEELKILYSSIGRYTFPALGLGALMLSSSIPDEDFDMYVARMIAVKKKFIEKMITQVDDN